MYAHTLIKLLTVPHIEIALSDSMLALWKSINFVLKSKCHHVFVGIFACVGFLIYIFYYCFMYHHTYACMYVRAPGGLWPITMFAPGCGFHYLHAVGRGDMSGLLCKIVKKCSLCVVTFLILMLLGFWYIPVHVYINDVYTGKYYVAWQGKEHCYDFFYNNTGFFCWN